MSIQVYQLMSLDKKRISQGAFVALLAFGLVFSQLTNPEKSYADTSCTPGTGSFTETINGNVHTLTFVSNGAVNASCQFEVPADVYSLDYLIVAGGGGGNSGGGGAGGLVTSWAVQNQAGTSTVAERNNPLGVSPGDLLNITVGVGGSGGSGGNYSLNNQNSYPLGTNGNASILGGITANGGGRGGFGFGCEAGEDLSACDQRGASGGSNGGAAYDNGSVNNTLVSGTAYVGATSLGNIGGASVGQGGYRAGSGGGGAGAAGASANVLHVGGAGGAGVRVDISGTSLIYACGGGGGVNENDGPRFARYGAFRNGVNSFENISDIGVFEEYNYIDYYGYQYSEDGTNWYYDSEDDSFSDPLGNVYIHVSAGDPETDDFVYTDVDGNSYTIIATRVVLYQVPTTPTGRYIDSNNDYWNFSFDNSSWTNQTTNAVWQRPTIGGGSAGCLGAGSGSSINVDSRQGPSSDTDATSGANNFGHGGGGTDPESTRAGDGGSGVVIVRYVTQDPNCPNDHNAGGVPTPIACTAAVTISAGGASVSTFVNGSPISYTTGANSPTVSILTTPTGLSSSVSSGNIVVSAPANSSLAGGTYPLRYRISEGGNFSDAVLLVTVSDPEQHSPVLVLVDPRATEVILPEIVVGNINATLVCVTPRAGGAYPNNPVVDVTQSVANITKTLFASSGGMRLIDNSNNNAPSNNQTMQNQVQYISISKNSSDTYLLPGDSSRIIDINVSNTATGGNGSCRGGTSSSVELRPLGIDKILRKGTVGLKN